MQHIFLLLNLLMQNFVDYASLPLYNQSEREIQTFIEK